MKLILRSLILLAIAAPTPALAQSSDRPELMIVGTPHFDNPGLDIADSKIEDVLAPDRQKEIVALVDALAAFRPTHVAVEWPAGEQAKLDQRYAAYRAGRYTLTRDERDQIALRLAAKLGLARVDAVDWNDEPPGKDEDYDFPAWLSAHGRGAEWTDFQKAMQKEADADTAYDHCHAVADWIRTLAEPTSLRAMAMSYFSIARFGDNARNPGAAWVGTWYARNLRIFDNLQAVGARPRERTLVVYGAGHASLLRDFVAQTGWFTLVEPGPFLPAAGPSRCARG